MATAAAEHEGSDAQEGEEYQVGRGLSESDVYSQYWERDDHETTAAMRLFPLKEVHMYRLHPKFMWYVVQQHGSHHSMSHAGLESEGLFPL